MLLTIHTALTAVLPHSSEDSSRALAASPKACDQAGGRAAWVERGREAALRKKEPGRQHRIQIHSLECAQLHGPSSLCGPTAGECVTLRVPLVPPKIGLDSS